MSDYGLTPTGFKPKRLDVILEEANQQTRVIFGDNINLSPESPDGQINGVLSEAVSNNWQLANAVYEAFDPEAAEGVAQSRLYLLNGIRRLPAVYSTVTATFTGSVGAIIPALFEVKALNNGPIFVTIAEATIGGSGNISIPMRGKETGPLQAPANELTQIVNPISGLASVTNPLAAVAGQNEETDEEFRQRRALSTEFPSTNITDSLYSKLSNLPGVTSVRVYDNKTNVVDANGLPPHSFNCVVLGGVDADIAQTIWLSHPTGILSFGSVFNIVVDSQGFAQPVYFDRPTNVPIYIIVNTNVFGQFPNDGVTQIKNAIITEGNKFLIGDLVRRTALAAAATTGVVGHSIQSFYIGLAPAPTGRLDLQMGIRQLANFSAANITVNVS